MTGRTSEQPAGDVAVTATEEATPAGSLAEIHGAVVRARLARPLALGEVVYVGPSGLLGEVIALDRRRATIQVYEETTGLKPGDPVVGSGAPLAVELGPGLLGAIFDGVQRPLDQLAVLDGAFITPGRRVPALDRKRHWRFEPRQSSGTAVEPGTLLGVVQETPGLAHPILAPPGMRGRLVDTAPAGSYQVTDPLARVEQPDGTVVALSLLQRWRVRVPRPFATRLPATAPLVTGQRVLDTLFPLPRGGAASVPGGFGTGKTVLQHQLCKWSEADVIVFVGCGERGNEMTEIVRKLPDLTDPRTGRPLAERTILIANTSNMPVAAREASIYTGITLAEYYRDLGYHVLLLADSTTRWAEALREIAGRLGDLPAEEGYPSYLASRLAQFYERAGEVVTLSGRRGSVSIVAALSPPGSDLTEPVTRHTQRFTRTCWVLDKGLAAARVFPAVSVRDSYSSVPDALVEWWQAHGSADWPRLRLALLSYLEEAYRLEQMARLIGSECLPERQQFVLRLGALVQEAFLQQNAYDPLDARSSPARQTALARALVRFAVCGLEAIGRGATAAVVASLAVVTALERAKSTVGDADLDRIEALAAEAERQCQQLAEHVERERSLLAAPDQGHGW